MSKQISKRQRDAFYRWWRRQTKFKYFIPLEFRVDDSWIDGACMDVERDLPRMFQRWLAETKQKIEMELKPKSFDGRRW